VLKFSILFAAASDGLDKNPLPEPVPVNLFGLGLREILIVVGVAVILGLLLFLWAYFTYKDRRHRSGNHLSRPIYRADKKAVDADPKKVKLRKKRRRHPDHLPRNPTLGETGGLPPMRSDEPPAETAPQS
jgi:FtsZ-interacting cell division protein ZipA